MWFLSFLIFVVVPWLKKNRFRKITKKINFQIEDTNWPTEINSWCTFNHYMSVYTLIRYMHAKNQICTPSNDALRFLYLQNSVKIINLLLWNFCGGKFSKKYGAVHRDGHIPAAVVAVARHCRRVVAHRSSSGIPRPLPSHTTQVSRSRWTMMNNETMSYLPFLS